MKLSVVVPARNEEGAIADTVRALASHLSKEAVPHEILVVNDGSTDGTAAVLTSLQREIPTVRPITNTPPHGFGMAVRKGLDLYSGDAVAVYMADASDSPEDLVRFYRTLVEKRVDCVFGTRFARTSKVKDYPWPKLILNRLANQFIQVLFQLPYNDVTNAFKLYSRRAVDGVRPLISPHFNLTVEMPLKAIVRGYTYAVVPNDWTNRKAGESKLKIREMGSRYLFIVLYCLVEKWLSRGDYRVKPAPAQAPTPQQA